MFEPEDPDYYGIEDEQCSCGGIRLKGSQFCRECEESIKEERAKEQEMIDYNNQILWEEYNKTNDGSHD